MHVEKFLEKPASCLNGIHSLNDGLYDELYDLLQLLEDQGLDVPNLNLILIPDGLLWEFPLEAAFHSASQKYFYQQVGTIRYGLSLRTLLLQQEIEKEDHLPTQQLHATIFANPHTDNENLYLPRVKQEVVSLRKIFTKDLVKVNGDLKPHLSSRQRLRSQHGLGTLLWSVSHGGMLIDEVLLRNGEIVKVRCPSALMFDGPVSDVRMVEEGYSYRHVRLIHANACLLGRMGRSTISKELEGFVASLTLLGSRRISSARWELADFASCEFASHYAKALVEHAYVNDPSPHAFATAFKQGIDQFRQMDNGKFDHPFFWAPYFLCGLG